MANMNPTSTPHRPTPRLQSAVPERRRNLATALVILATLAWLHYTIHGFRLPWQAITISDSNSGAALRQALFGLAGMIALFRLITTRTLGLALSHHLPWTIFALALTASSLWSDLPSMSMKRALIFALGYALLATMTHASKHPVRLMQRCVVYSAGGVAIASLLMMVGLPADCSSIISRPGLAGMSNHPNTLSAVLFTGWILAMGFRPSSAKERSWLRINQIAILIALILAGSVTGTFVAVVGTVTHLVLISNSYRRGILILLGVVAVLLVAAVGPDQVKSMAFDAVERDESLSGRDTLWEDVYQEAKKRPVFGSGFGGFWYEGRGREITGTWNPRQSHLAYLDVFVDLGAVGLIASVILVGAPLYASVFWGIRNGANDQRRAVASIIALGAALLGAYGLSQSFLFRLDQFAMLALLWGLLLLGNRDRNSITSEFSGADSGYE